MKRGQRLRQMQEELGDAEARYRALVEQAPIIVYEWEFGDLGRWRYVSPRIEALLGYTAEEFIADPDLWFDRIHEDDRARVVAAEELSQETAQGGKVEYRMRHRDGHIVWVRDDAIAFQEPREAPYFRGILSDVTQEKEAQLALAALNEELEQRVQSRTAELEETNVELREAKEEAEVASRAKSELLSRASHELRTPLNAILGFGQLLEASDLSARDLEGVAHILSAGRRLLELVDDILDVSTVQAGQLALSIEPVAVDEVVQEAIASARSAAAERRVRLETGETSPGAFVLADRQRLRQVLADLMSNAIRFNVEGGSVRLGWIADDDTTRLTMVDTGKGISPEALPRLFTLFERADRSGADAGTGLGLPLAKALIEAMGGSISVESAPDAGTSVTLVLASAKDPVRGVEGGDASTGGVRRDAPGRTIVCIEDNLANFTLVQRILDHRPGITLLRAMHGGTGIQLTRDQRPDLVLLDLHLPDMSGEEVLVRLRSEPRTRDVPVVAVSAETNPEVIERMRQLGIRAFFPKPIDVERFLDLVDETLEAGANPIVDGG
jgi:PAS domain S-box-containing protein